MHIKDDFQAGAPISQVPTDWFNAVAKFINGLIPGDGIVFTKSCDGTPTAISIGDKVNQGTETYTDNTSASVECPSGDTPEPSTLTFTAWSKGTGSGLKLRLYALVDGSTNGEHVLFPVDVTIAPSGVVTSVAAPTGDHGVYIGA